MIDVVAGARPNLVKVAPILRELRRRDIAHRFVWTGQHEGALDLRQELGLPVPDIDLSNAPIETRKSLDALSMALVEVWRPCVPASISNQPSAVVVVGDVTSTLAAALAATAHGIPVVHVEAGLRSGDFTMPEERNRCIVDRLSDLCLCTEREAYSLLLRDCFNGVPEQRRRRCSVFVGNVMIDSLRWAESRIAESGVVTRITNRELETGTLVTEGDLLRYALVTIHRPSNVDTPQAWDRTTRAVDAICMRGLDVLWVRHPRVPEKLNMRHGQYHRRFIGPEPYGQMVQLMKGAVLVATDSGGVQEETTALGVPCLTLRENTERPITVTEGTNIVVGLDPARIGHEVDEILAGRGKKGKIPEGWDGHAAARIVDAIQKRYP